MGAVSDTQLVDFRQSCGRSLVKKFARAMLEFFGRYCATPLNEWLN